MDKNKKHRARAGDGAGPACAAAYFDKHKKEKRAEVNAGRKRKQRKVLRGSQRAVRVAFAIRRTDRLVQRDVVAKCRRIAGNWRAGSSPDRATSVAMLRKRLLT